MSQNDQQPGNDNSPPSAKRLRPSPPGNISESPLPMAPIVPSYTQQVQQQPHGTPGPHHVQVPNGAMRGPGSMSLPPNFNGGPMPQHMGMMPMSVGAPPHMSPGMANQHAPGGMMPMKMEQSMTQVRGSVAERSFSLSAPTSLAAPAVPTEHAGVAQAWRRCEYAYQWRAWGG